jgi:hypothetical protein
VNIKYIFIHRVREPLTLEILKISAEVAKKIIAKPEELVPEES